MMKFLFYLFIGYIIYSWVRLLFSSKSASNKQAQSSVSTDDQDETYFQKKRRKMEDELSEYVDYKEVE